MNIENGVIYGGPFISDNIEATSLGDYCLQKLRSQDGKTFLVNGSTGEEIPTAYILNKSLQIAKALRLMDVGPGDIIGITIENRKEYPSIVYAAFFVGATIAPINPTYNEREFLDYLSLVKPRIVFTSRMTAEIIKKIAKTTLKIDKIVILYKENRCDNSNILTYDDLLGTVSADDDLEFVCAIAKDPKSHVSMIMTSSGTTGFPKGVELSETNVLMAIKQSLTRIIPFDEEIRVICTLPWYHAYGCFLTISLMMSKNIKYVYMANFKDSVFLSCIEKYKIHILMVVPPLVVFLATNPLVENYDLSSVIGLFCGAAPLGKDILIELEKRLPGASMSQGYGMSEGTLAILQQTFDYTKPGSVGRIQPGQWGKVICPDTGKLCGYNEPGELWFKSDMIMKGYIGDEQSTRQTIDENGWLHTGDIGYYDEDLEWFIVDRIKELIKYKGYQVAPAELESILITHSDILDCAVVGRPDNLAGELPMAFVVRRPDSQISEKNIIDYLASRVSHTKQLRGGVQFIDEIPKTQTGKILRRILKTKIDSKSKL